MKPIIILIVLLMNIPCKAQKKTMHKANKDYPFYVGTYTKGNSQGIYKYALQKNGIIKKIGLAVQSENPSFLAWSHDKKFLIAVNEINSVNGNGTVASFLVKDDKLIPINKSTSGGAHPCFVSTNKYNYVLTANYSSGNVGLLKLNSKGELSKLLDIQQHTDKGLNDQQKSAHAHSAWFDFDDLNIISIDLGTNDLWFSKLDTLQQKLTPSTPNKIAIAKGAGPRHLTFHPNKKWIYVINELTSTVTQLQKNDKGIYAKLGSVSTLPKNYKESNTCADIHISADGKFVYASNRGHNSIAIFKVNNLDGNLKLITNEPTLGDSPRNFSLSPNDDFLLVANQLTNNIVAFKRDKKTGLLEFTNQIEAPAPVCILFQ